MDGVSQPIILAAEKLEKMRHKVTRDRKRHDDDLYKGGEERDAERGSPNNNQDEQGLRQDGYELNDDGEVLGL